MKLEINYYGVLSDLTGQSQEIVELETPTVAFLFEILYLRYPQLKTTTFKVASENQIIENDATITTTSISLLPPFSGG